MKYVRILIFASLLFILLPAGSALAAPEVSFGPYDRIITGGDYELSEGEVEDGNVVVFGGSADIENGAVLDGDLTVFGGDVELDGTVDGSLVVFGGKVKIHDDATVDGDCVLFGGSFEIDEGARITGSVVTNPEDVPFDAWKFDKDGLNLDHDQLPITPEIPEIPAIPEVPEITVVPPSVPSTPITPRVIYHNRPSFASKVGGAFLSAVAFGAMALLLALFWPKHIEKVNQTIKRESVMSGLVGFLTLITVALVTPILVILFLVLIIVCVGLLGLPLIALIWIVLFAASLFGWAAIGQITGRWMANRLNLSGVSGALEAGLGTFTISLVLGISSAIFLIGIGAGLVQFILFCIGLGAVVLTRFGRQDYVKGQPILPSRPPKTPKAPAQPAAPIVPVEVPTPVSVPPAVSPAPAPKAAPPVPPSPVKPVVHLEEDESQFKAPPLDQQGPFPEQ